MDYIIPLRIYKLHPDVNLPKLATEGSACFDIEANFWDKTVTMYTQVNGQMDVGFTGDRDSIAIPAGWRAMIPTGFIFEIPNGYSVRVHPRSGLSIKQGITFPNCEGVIDSDFVHECKILIFNTSSIPFNIKTGDRIAQGELVKTLDYQIWETTSQPVQKTTRAGGYGSTGV